MPSDQISGKGQTWVLDSWAYTQTSNVQYTYYIIYACVHFPLWWHTAIYMLYVCKGVRGGIRGKSDFGCEHKGSTVNRYRTHVPVTAAEESCHHSNKIILNYQQKKQYLFITHNRIIYMYIDGQKVKGRKRQFFKTFFYQNIFFLHIVIINSGIIIHRSIQLQSISYMFIINNRCLTYSGRNPQTLRESGVPIRRKRNSVKRDKT